MAPAFVAGTPLLATPRQVPSWANQRTSSLRMGSQAPPESRISSNYPISKRFLAPTISIDQKSMELVSSIGLYMEEAPLDTELARTITAERIGHLMVRRRESDPTGPLLPPDELFPTAATDEGAEHTAERFYPMTRRDETPIISFINSDNEDDCSLRVDIGSVVATPPEEHEEERVSAFWRAAPAGIRIADDVIASAFPVGGRNKAPVIDIGIGSIEVSMKEIIGIPECDTFLPVDDRFHAPVIRIKPPAGDWDKSGYVEVANVEVQLPLVEAVE